MIVSHVKQFYIDGQWVDPAEPRAFPVLNPATEEEITQISLGSKTDVDRAVAAARRAFEGFSQTTREERIDLLERIRAVYEARYDDFVAVITAELGAPASLSKNAQAAVGLGHLDGVLAALKAQRFEGTSANGDLIRREAIGVCGLITPWNWPINQIVLKVLPALAAGCTMVLKPSELTPLDALLYAEVLHEAGVPAGVFNLVNGDGPGVGAGPALVGPARMRPAHRHPGLRQRRAADRAGGGRTRPRRGHRVPRDVLDPSRRIGRRVTTRVPPPRRRTARGHPAPDLLLQPGGTGVGVDGVVAVRPGSHRRR